MKAVAVSEYGATPELTEVDVATVGADEVLIRVSAAGINPMDTVIAQGAWADRFDAEFPLVLGSDVAGTIESLGEKVRGFEIGDAVFGQLLLNPLGSTGTYAEYVVAPASASLAAIPSGIPATVAAALPTTAGTARGIVDQLLDQLGDLTSRRTLIIGAAGGVGSSLTQFAIAAGAEVITVAADTDAARMLGYGAVANLDRAAGPVAESVRAAYPDGVDILLDLANTGADFDSLARAVLRPGGTALSTRFAAQIDALAASGYTGINFSANITPELLGRVAAAVADGTLTPPPITTVSLEEVPALLASPRPGGGKTVIAVRPA